jgi:hypothetical protein
MGTTDPITRALSAPREDVATAATMIVCGLPIARSVVRALLAIAAAGNVDLDVAVHGLAVASSLSSSTVVACAERGNVLVLDDRGGRLGMRAELAGIEPARMYRREISHDIVTGGDVLVAIVKWLVTREAIDQELAARVVGDLIAIAEPVGKRVPRRGATLHRDVPRPLAAALVLAQATIGVPVRVDDVHRVYQTEGGGCLAIVTSEQMGVEGLACAPACAQAGVYVVTGAVTAEVQAAAAAGGATVEAVDDNRPRAIASAIARACAAPRLAPHVIVTVPGTQVVRTGVDVGADPELVVADRLAVAALPAEAVGIEPRSDDLSGGVELAVLDADAVRVGIDNVSEMSGAWYDVRVRRGLDVVARAHWIVTRRLLRSIAKVEV